MRFTLRDARLIDAATDIARGAISIDGARIDVVESEDGGNANHRVPPPGTTVDARGMIIMPGFIDVLRAHGNNLTLKGRYEEGMSIDKRLIQLRPADYLAHYNLACSFALLKQPEQALKTLRRAVELGYRDFRYMKQDRDLDSIRRDPRFKQLLREFENG